jgi:Flp pilus assembly protein TadD
MSRKYEVGMRLLLSVITLLAFTVGCSGPGKNPRDPFKAQMEKQRALDAAEAKEAKRSRKMTTEEYERLGDSYLRQGQIDMAFLQYDRALRLNPERVAVRYKVARLFLEKGLAQDAKREFHAILKIDPNHALSYEGMGWASLAMGEFEEAEGNLKKAVQLNAGLWQAHNLLGVIYDHWRRFEEARLHYRTAIRLKPDEALLLNNLGTSFLLQGEFEKAVESFTEALKIEDRHPTIYNNLALALCKLERYEEALEVFRKGGNEAAAQNNLGYLYLMEGKYKEAIRAFEKALQIKPGFYVRAHENLQKALALQENP